MPTHQRSFTPEWQRDALEKRMHRALARATTPCNFSTHHLPTLLLGAHVLIQHHSTKRNPHRCCRSWGQQGHLENSLGTLVPPKSLPTPPKRGGYVRNGRTYKRRIRDRPTSSPGLPTSSPGARHRLASESAASNQDLRPSNPTLGQNTQRAAALPGLVLDYASNTDL